ncbi:hypothetical protein MYX78_10855 [Acidobacteria bacterium AH-259-G07]|nr:hypothetical protein [Acidobacteria bacterium AH-259-G07]
MAKGGLVCAVIWRPNAEIAQLISECHLMVSLRRKIASVLLGVVYGGAIENGVTLGIDFVTGEDGFLLDWPLTSAGLWVASAAIAGFLAAYSSQSFFCGVVSGSVIAALGLAAIGITARLQQYLWVAVPLSVGASVITAHYGRHLPISGGDVASGRLFNINWKHWIWIWLPGEYMIANAVWLAYPVSLLVGMEITPLRLVYEILRTPVFLVVLGYGCFKAFESISEKAGHTRLQSSFRFLFWFFIFPVLLNLLRLFGF